MAEVMTASQSRSVSAMRASFERAVAHHHYDFDCKYWEKKKSVKNGGTKLAVDGHAQPCPVWSLFDRAKEGSAWARQGTPQVVLQNGIPARYPNEKRMWAHHASCWASIVLEAMTSQMQVVIPNHMCVPLLMSCSILYRAAIFLNND
jgi:hypothetical protein